MVSIHGMSSRLGTALATLLPPAALRGFADRLCERDPQVLLEAFAPYFNRAPDLDHLPDDLPPGAYLDFEDLAGLFASSSLNHGVISMPIRQAAYLFGLVRRLPAQKVIEVGRYKGGSTLVIAAALRGEGKLWSIDIGEKEARLRSGAGARSYDQQTADACRRFGLRADLIVGDSRTIELETGEVDLVFIDGDHSYDGVRNDFQRFGRRVRLGGAVLFDDAFDEQLFKSHTESVGRLVREIAAGGEFRLAKVVDRLAHLERIRSAPE